MTKRKREWMVPLNTKQTATAFVLADSAEQALAMVRRGDWADLEAGELTDWEIRGDAEPNE